MSKAGGELHLIQAQVAGLANDWGQAQTLQLMQANLDIITGPRVPPLSPRNPQRRHSAQR